MDGRPEPSPPAARDDGLLVEEIGNEAVVYDVEAKEAHALSPVAAAVFAGSDGRRSLAELARFASSRAAESVTEDQVWDALVQLEACNLLKPPSGGMSRRGFVRAGATVAATGVFVTSLAMPSIAAVASCHFQRNCNTDTDCGLGAMQTCMEKNPPPTCASCKCVASGATGYTGCNGGGNMCENGFTSAPATGFKGQCGFA